MKKNFTANKALLLIAFGIFVLIAFGVTIFDMNELEEVAAGLAFLAAAQVVP
jgi:hypothetical protein